MTNLAESHLSTHDVLNQPLPLVDINLFEGDAALKKGVVREGAAWAADELSRFGARAGAAVSERELPAPIAALMGAHPVLMNNESARALGWDATLRAIDDFCK